MKRKGRYPFREKNRLNDLDGKTWTRYSISIWEISKTAEEAKLKHPALFPMALCSRLADIYTRKGDVILDPFMGSGSTLVVAKDKERKGIGFDINPAFVKLAKRRLSQQKLVEVGVIEPEVYWFSLGSLLLDAAFWFAISFSVSFAAIKSVNMLHKRVASKNLSVINV